MSLTLHNFFRSSASVRVRAALNLKGLAYDQRSYMLRKGEHRSPAFLALNPQGLVPALELADGTVLAQSLAIIEYLDETQPDPPLLPADARDRAHARSLAYAVACDVHPVNNLRVLQRLETEFGAGEEAVAGWFRHWATESFGPLETTLATDPRTGAFCLGDRPGLADLCLFAQAINNRRFGVPIAPYPTIARIVESCLALPAFRDALPDAQPDAA
ncbi:maleylacetoacetate isomerase [Azospirillum doebereinerae]|uniref:Maleylacetoacetate isomerase n=1 Tax=Azospirillum doebereinerae TaxID=92933 RepID=A0A3S0WJL1_9PROT|nr:maleylacetoacetate isomerase [Azospirillum doebereinerae]MCG5241280.1 maleylacetoacetate isomerase [Azospirillum doebereinerae]RUQ66401.1 maleylacetoacetate isomerase [Azospirillum doebereinerae]